jgi:hypothetical protein
MRIAIPIFSFFLFLQFIVVGQCKISQNKFPDGTMYLETEPSLMYQTSKKKLVEKLSTDKENYFVAISPTPFPPKPSGRKVKKDLIVFLSNNKTYTLKHFDSRYIDQDSSFEILYLFNTKDIPDFQLYAIKKVTINDGTGVDATYNLILHTDAIKKQLACFLKKKED